MPCPLSLQVLGTRGNLPDVFTEVEISFYLLRRLLGVKTQEGSKQAKVQKLQKQEILMVNIGSTATGGKVLAVKGELAKIQLTQPVCTQVRHRTASRLVVERDTHPTHTPPFVPTGTGEDRSEPTCGQALASHRLGPNPKRHQG